MKKFKILILCFLIFFECAKSDQKKVKVEDFVAPEDLRREAEGPIETEYGVNFSIYAPNAKFVSVVGDFNNWIDNRHVMKKNIYGVWSITIPLKKGIYSYKFNLDGLWIIDKNNPNTVGDKFGDIRSVVEVKEGVKFYEEPIYSGYTDSFEPQVSRDGILFTFKDKFANRVSVAGTFNNWEKDEYFMSKNQNGVWYIKIQLPRGKYYYKYNVDGEWHYDPKNPLKEDDGYGSYKSILEVKYDIQDRPSAPIIIDYQIVRFEYYNKDLPSDVEIYVVGDFNDWEIGKTVMRDDDFDKIWFATVRLKPGKYYYNFVIKDQEFLDPANSETETLVNGKEVSVLKVEFPKNMFNVKFSIRNDKAKEIYLVGDFNNWNPEVDKMLKDETGLFYITKFLAAGEYAYQFIIDGRWELDPNNKWTVMDLNGDLNSFLKVGVK
jgi:1,4-alpha-glucan branching enzyme